MTAKDMLRRVKKKPFVPFRIIVSEGGNYDVRHPDQIMVMRDSIVVGIPGQSEEDIYETSDLVDLIHVVRLEPLTTKNAKGNK